MNPALGGFRAIFVELFHQDRAGAVDAAFHGAGGAVAQGGRFVIGKALAEHEADGIRHVGRQAIRTRYAQALARLL